MSQKLPVGEFGWVTELTMSDILNYDDSSPIGFFVEVDARFPEHLHNHFSDFPPMPEKITITPEITSYITRKAKKQQIGARAAENYSNVKLAPNLFDKTNYKLHISVLKCYIDLG